MSGHRKSALADLRIMMSISGRPDIDAVALRGPRKRRGHLRVTDQMIERGVEGDNMRIAVVGGGPGGLYFAYIWKRRHPADHVELFEQNAPDATFGFGVVFSEQALEFLREDDPETVAAIAPRMESWTNITLNLRGERIEIDGIGFSSIGRLALLRILQQRAEAVGVT